MSLEEETLLFVQDFGSPGHDQKRGRSLNRITDGCVDKRRDLSPDDVPCLTIEKCLLRENVPFDDIMSMSNTQQLLSTVDGNQKLLEEKRNGMFGNFYETLLAMNDLLYDRCDDCADDEISYNYSNLPKSIVQTRSNDDLYTFCESTINNSTLLSESIFNRELKTSSTIATGPIYRDFDNLRSYEYADYEKPFNQKETRKTVANKSRRRERKVIQQHGYLASSTTRSRSRSAEKAMKKKKNPSNCDSMRRTQSKRSSRSNPGLRRGRSAPPFRRRSKSPFGRQRRSKVTEKRKPMTTAVLPSHSLKSKSKSLKSIERMPQKISKSAHSRLIEYEQPLITTRKSNRSRSSHSRKRSKSPHTIKKTRSKNSRSTKKLPDTMKKNSKSSSRSKRRLLRKRSTGRLSMRSKSPMIRRLRGSSTIKTNDKLRGDIRGNYRKEPQRSKRGASSDAHYESRNDIETIEFDRPETTATEGEMATGRQMPDIDDRDITADNKDSRINLERKESGTKSNYLTKSSRKALFLWRQPNRGKKYGFEKKNKNVIRYFTNRHVQGSSTATTESHEQVSDAGQGLAFPVPNNEGQEIALQDGEHYYEDPAHVHSMLTIPSLEGTASMTNALNDLNDDIDHTSAFLDDDESVDTDIAALLQSKSKNRLTRKNKVH